MQNSRNYNGQQHGEQPAIMLRASELRDSCGAVWADNSMSAARERGKSNDGVDGSRPTTLRQTKLSAVTPQAIRGLE